MKKNIVITIILSMFLSCSSESIKDAPKVDTNSDVSDDVLKKLAYCNGAWQGDTDLEKVEYPEKLKREFEWRGKITENEGFPSCATLMLSFFFLFFPFVTVCSLWMWRK